MKSNAYFHRLVVGGSVLVVGAALIRPAAAGCTDGESQALESAQASVAIFSNIRRSKDSIAVVAEELLERAFEHRSEPASHCAEACVGNDRSVAFFVSPIQFLPESKQKPVCLKLEQQTSQSPITFSDRSFQSLDDVNQWIMNFSRGKGKEGKQLYDLCASNCSPRYTFFISQNEPGYRLDANVVCGRARDKSSSRYSLETRLQLECESRANADHVKAATE